MGKWYAALEQEKRQPTADIKAKAAELTANMKTDMEKIEALYDYVGPNFRYVSLSLGVGRYQPHSAADVLHNQYGDCKDKNTLLAALLDASGFHPYSVLIGSSRKLDPEVPSPAQSDHVITLLPLGKEEVWMDTTRKSRLPLALIQHPKEAGAVVVDPAAAFGGDAVKSSDGKPAGAGS